jgi:L-lactate utilization protein LutB
MVMPAIHKSRQQVGGLFEAHVGRPVSREDIGEMAGVARQELRRVFAEAQVGMTGANALIAETGTVMLVTNEGNGRLTSSLPPVHVVLAGWEKLVPTWEDATAQARLLARSGTAQDITVYTTFITGPDRPDRELHIVIVDNGRSEMAADPDFSEALRCIRCAACADVCPPYQVGWPRLRLRLLGRHRAREHALPSRLDAAAGRSRRLQACATKPVHSLS